MMKRYLPSLIVGSLGFVSGFVVCLFCFVFPASPEPAAMVLPVNTTLLSDRDSKNLELQPYLIQPTYPPRIVGKM